MTKYLIGIIIVLTLGLATMTKCNSDNVKEKDRFKDNQTALLQDVKHYRTKDSLSAASVQKLTLEKRELKENKKELVKTLDNLKIKLKRVLAVSTTSTETTAKIKTIVRDSLVYRDGRTDTLHCIDFENKWTTLIGCELNKEFTGINKSRDSIVQVLHRIPRQFLFIKWGTKAVRQDVVSKNPNSTITFTEYIELKK
jgi:hypothetical protein